MLLYSMHNDSARQYDQKQRMFVGNEKERKSERNNVCSYSGLMHSDSPSQVTMKNYVTRISVT